jgi:arginase
VSRLRARCPDCRTLTAVAVGPEYQCHSCGREFCAGLVRVPRAWGAGGEAMAEAAYHELPYPEASVIAADTLAEQTLMVASELPDRPVVLGGCCCAHVGAIEALSAGTECLAVVWIDAHGDLNTPSSSPSGNAWGMPLRMVLDDGAVLAKNVALVGARALDPPEVEFIDSAGVQTGEGAIERALERADSVYVALDCDAVEPSELAVFMPEPGGLRLDELEQLLADLAGRTRVAGLGLTGLVREVGNEQKLARLAAALGL